MSQPKEPLDHFRAHLKDREKVTAERMKHWATPESGEANEATRMYWMCLGENNAFGAMAGTLEYFLKGGKP